MATIETLASGFGLVEGPRPDGAGGVLFSDVVGGGVHRWSPSGVSLVLARRRGIGGLVLHVGGGVLVTGRDLSLGETTVVPAPEGVTGFNDLVTADDGSVLVGALRFRPMLGERPVPGEVWRVLPGPQLTLFAAGIRWPNGIGISPDGETVYVSNYSAGEVLAFDADGTGRRVFASIEEGEPDGLAVDAEGCVWVAAGEGKRVLRFTPEGKPEGVLGVPGATFVASVAFDGAELLIATAGALLRTPVGVRGRPVPPARVTGDW
jgi:sugar lactone lactonase YvrE